MFERSSVRVVKKQVFGRSVAEGPYFYKTRKPTSYYEITSLSSP
ncbi:hypothetical protein Hanom_Chr12g01167011 [Helianthus anomalus]